jgi:stearoyl-CoA desaturase (delta-9 desaturase)
MALSHLPSAHPVSTRNEELVQGMQSDGGLWRILKLITLLAPPVLVGVTMWTCWKGWFSAVDLALFVAFYGITGFGITVGFHRYFTHQSFRTRRPIAWLLGVMGSMALQGPLIWWVATHRVHHQHSDDPQDPHSPHFPRTSDSSWASLKGFLHAHLGWVLEPSTQDLSAQGRDLLADPVCLNVHKWFPFWGLFGLLCPGLIGGLVTHSWWGAASGFLWGGAVRLFMVHHVTWSINSICHLWGTRDYESRDQSRNNLVVGLLALGEGWHNNHHAFPASARHGLEWWQLDVSWILIRTLALLGLASNVRTVPVERRRAMRSRRTQD